jgi:hypothetical protein
MIDTTRAAVLLLLAAFVAAGCNSLYGIHAHALEDGAIGSSSRDGAVGGEARTGDAFDAVADGDGDARDVLDVLDADRSEIGDDLGAGGAGAVVGPCLVVDAQTGAGPWTTVSWGLYLVPANLFIPSAAAVWGPNHYYDSTFAAILSAVPHAPPYDSELPDGITAAGFVSSGCIDASAVQTPLALVLSVLVVPTSAALVGASFEVPDSDGPVITGTVEFGGTLFNGTSAFLTYKTSVPKAPAAYGYPPVSSTKTYGFRHVVETFNVMTFLPGAVTPQIGDFTFELDVSADAGSTSQRLHFTIR